jgi:hypothetical protein
MDKLLDEIKTEISHLKNNKNPHLQELILLSSGSFSHGYHVEFSFDDHDIAHEVCEELASHDILAHISSNRVYIKDSESICNLLALVGAHKSLYKLNDEIVMRSMVNTSNRRANCDKANISRSIETAQSQIGVISKLVARDDFKTLAIELQTTAKARIENPTASYDELAQILGVTKSGLVHRIKKLLAVDF